MKRNDLTIADIVCPKCKSENWYQYGTDEQEFCVDGTGHYRFDIHCSDCGKDSQVSFEFEYHITNSRDLANPTEKGGMQNNGL
jgi:transposase-like protein